MRRILLLDDEQHVLSALQRALRQSAKEQTQELDIELFTSPKKAILRLSEAEFDFAISDFHMPEMNGIDFLKIARELQADTVRMMLSASSDFRTPVAAINEAGIFRYIAKPWETENLLEIIAQAGAYRDQLREDRGLADALRLQRDALSPQEMEARRLEDSEPGITQVNWGPDGSVILD